MAPFHVSGFSSSSGNMTPNHGLSGIAATSLPTITPEALEIAGRCTESMLALDAQFPVLAEKLRIGSYILDIFTKQKYCLYLLNIYSLANLI